MSKNRSFAGGLAFAFPFTFSFGLSFPPTAQGGDVVQKKMSAFDSDAELTAYLKGVSANRGIARLGELAARQEIAVDDRCKASCVDWYGNARPIFLCERTFALMGYELVEGRLGARSIRELRRINFTTHPWCLGLHTRGVQFNLFNGAQHWAS